MTFFLRSYALSHLFAFSHWFDTYLTAPGSEYADEPSPSLGFWTFMAVGEIAAPEKPVPEGYFGEYFEEPGVLKSNIFTMFRGLIYDFGVAGSVLFMGVLGTLSSAAYYHMLRHACAPIAQSFFVALFGFMYSSYLISIGTWASVYVAALILLGVLFAAELSHRWRSQ